jgi:hypothetical protein
LEEGKRLEKERGDWESLGNWGWKGIKRGEEEVGGICMEAKFGGQVG